VVTHTHRRCRCRATSSYRALPPPPLHHPERERRQVFSLRIGWVQGVVGRGATLAQQGHLAASVQGATSQHTVSACQRPHVASQKQRGFTGDKRSPSGQYVPETKHTTAHSHTHTHTHTCRSAAAAASCTTRGRPLLCVMAPLQLHVMRMPPDLTTPSASSFRRRYLPVARGREPLRACSTLGLSRGC
jgi:hypothetical protein